MSAGVHQAAVDDHDMVYNQPSTKHLLLLRAFCCRNRLTTVRAVFSFMYDLMANAGK